MHNAAQSAADGDSAHTIGYRSAVFQLSGAFAGTVTFEALVGPGDAWVAIRCKNLATNAVATTATAAGLYRVEDGVGGLLAVRARISTYTSGSFTIYVGLGQ